MSTNIWTGSFWRATVERMVRTAAQSGILVIAADQFDVMALDWTNFGGFAGGGAVLALLFSLAGNVTTGTGPSFTDAGVTSEVKPRRAYGQP